MTDINSPRRIGEVVQTPMGYGILLDIGKVEAAVSINGQTYVFDEDDVLAVRQEEGQE